MCRQPLELGKQPIENVFLRENQANSFYKSYKWCFLKRKPGGSQTLNQDKSFGLPQQVASISTDDRIKCPIFGESFAASIVSAIQVGRLF
jgi:hypothetical protein